MVEAVIFDWAGTTVDYGCFAPVQAFADVFEHHGVKPTMEETRAPMGMLKIDHIREMLRMERIASAWERVHGKRPDEDDAQALYALFEGKLLSILPRFAEPKPHVLDTVAELRAAGGYAPAFAITPDAPPGKGRPWPYMVFRNLEALGVSSVQAAAKVGDTASDMREGKAAGVFTIGVIEGSSELGLAQEEYEALSPAERDRARDRVEARFRAAGADAVVRTLAELPQLLRQER